MPVMSHRSPRQAPRSAVMSAAVGLQGVTVEAPGELRRDVGSDLVFPLFLGCVGRTAPAPSALSIEGVLADDSRQHGETRCQRTSLAQ